VNVNSIVMAHDPSGDCSTVHATMYLHAGRRALVAIALW
jgi:hypothetical protein